MSTSQTNTPPAFGAPQRRIDWADLKRRRRVRVRLLAAAAFVLAFAAGMAALALNADAHYSRGKEALAGRQFGAAAEEFAAARILVFSYRDADALRARAESALARSAAVAESERHREQKVMRLIDAAAGDVARGDIAALTAALQEARRLVPSGTLSGSLEGADLVRELQEAMRQTADGAMDAGRWNDARRLALAMLIVDPGDKQAMTAKTSAETSLRLEAKLAAAHEAAARGEWRRALRLALQVLAVRSSFPGAQAFVDRARVALIPKPAATPAAGGTTTTGSTGGTTTTAPPPAPPPPAPATTQPPPP